MGFIRYDTSKLKQIPILEIARKLGLRIKGKRALCFAPHDSNPSLNFDLRKNSWRCFGCGLGGDGVSLVEKALGMDFLAACAWLSNSFGIYDAGPEPRFIRTDPPAIESSKSSDSPIPELAPMQ